MFKTRSGSKYLQPHSIMLDSMDDEDTITEYLNTMERTHKGLRKKYNSIKDIESLDVLNESLLTYIDSSSNEAVFIIRGKVIQIYHILRSFAVLDIIYTMINFYVRNYIVPEYKNFTVASYNDFKIFTKRSRCLKSSGEVYCPISCENIKVGRQIVELPCGHQFSAYPIRRWLTKNSACCPNCRKDIRGEEYIDELIAGSTHRIYRDHYNSLYELYID